MKRRVYLSRMKKNSHMRRMVFFCGHRRTTKANPLPLTQYYLPKSNTHANSRRRSIVVIVLPLLNFQANKQNDKICNKVLFVCVCALYTCFKRLYTIIIHNYTYICRYVYAHLYSLTHSRICLFTLAIFLHTVYTLLQKYLFKLCDRRRRTYNVNVRLTLNIFVGKVYSYYACVCVCVWVRFIHIYAYIGTYISIHQIN